jgi:hypothetical protein
VSRFIPIEFPCGCVVEQPPDPGSVTFYVCDPHHAGHQEMTHLDGYCLGDCECPCCEFERFAKRRHEERSFEGRNVTPDNWKFFARLIARRRAAK